MSDSPRILLVAFTPFPAPTGDATRLAQRVTAFADAGYSLDVLTPKTPELPHVSKLLGARILRVPMPMGHELTASNAMGVRSGQTLPPGIFTPIGHMDSAIAANLRAITLPTVTGPLELAPLHVRYGAFERAVRRQLQSVEYDVVHTMDPFSAMAVNELKGGARLVFEAGGRTPGGAGDAALFQELRAREREAFRAAELVFVPTEEVGLRARGLGAVRENIHVLRPNADLELFRPAEDRRRRSASPVRAVLAAASLTSHELTLLMEALHILPALLEFQLHLSAPIGKDERNRILADPELSARISLEDPVLYEDLGPLYQRVDMGLVISEGPTWGELPAVRLQAAAEMMAAGLALIAPDVPSTREVLTDGRHALLVPPADAEGLADAIRSLVTHPSRRRSLGHAARTRASEVMDERRAAAKILSLYGTMLSPSISISASAYIEPSVTAAVAGPPSGPSTAVEVNQLTRPTSHLSEDELVALQKALPRKPRVPLKRAAEGVADDPTDPDMAIQRRVLLAELTQASSTDPDAPPPRPLA